jgi:hypothetical protein
MAHRRLHNPTAPSNTKKERKVARYHRRRAPPFFFFFSFNLSTILLFRVATLGDCAARMPPESHRRLFRIASANDHLVEATSVCYFDSQSIVKLFLLVSFSSFSLCNWTNDKKKTNFWQKKEGRVDFFNRLLSAVACRTVAVVHCNDFPKKFKHKSTRTLMVMRDRDRCI